MAYGFLQTVDQFTNGAGTTRTATITYAGGERAKVTLGFAGGASSCTVTDLAGNTYNQVGVYNGLGSGFMAEFEAIGCIAGATTVTMTTNASCAWRGIGIFTYGSLGATASYSSVYNEQATPTTGTDAVTSTNVTPLTQPAMIFAVSIDNTGTAAINAGTGANSRSALPTWNAALGFFSRVEDFRVTATTPVPATFTATSASSHTDTMASVTNEPAVGGSPGPLPRQIYRMP